MLRKISLGSAKRQRTKDPKGDRDFTGFSLLPRALLLKHRKIFMNCIQNFHSHFNSNQSMPGLCAGFCHCSPVMKRNQSVHYANRFNSTLFHPDQLIFALPIKPATLFSRRLFFPVRKGDVLITKNKFYFSGSQIGRSYVNANATHVSRFDKLLKCHPRG